jgi:hypothetical protein
MKNMVADEVYYTLIITILAIALSMSKTFLSCHLFNEDGQGHVELFKGEKLDQMFLKFVLLYSPSIHNLIVSLKHYPGDFNYIEYILKLKALSGYSIFKTIVFMVNRLD